MAGATSATPNIPSIPGGDAPPNRDAGEGIESFDFDDIDGDETEDQTRDEYDEDASLGDDDAMGDDDADEGDEGDEDDEGDEGDEDGGDADLTDIEYEGETYKVPSKLKDAFMREADYSRKTDELATLRRSTETERGHLERIAQISGAEISSYARLQAIEGQLADYQNVNWQVLQQQDPFRAQQAFMAQQQLQAAYSAEKDRLAGLRNERATAQTAADRDRLAATAEYARKTIPNWSPEYDAKLVRFAVEAGFTKEELTKAYTPGVYKLLNLAYLGDQYQKSQQRAKTPPKGGKQAEGKPSKRVRTNRAPSGGRKDINRMSTEEFISFRNKQEAAKAKARRR